MFLAHERLQGPFGAAPGTRYITGWTGAGRIAADRLLCDFASTPGAILRFCLANRTEASVEIIIVGIQRGVATYAIIVTHSGFLSMMAATSTCIHRVQR